ncbi:MAG: hypothetical protein Q4G25_16805, partial [Paracoccus sp. (in: a-proteobacteria)]|nr:hypothetical protein [Paracoccus sp. (in: a-proteobacteria)]
RQGREQRFRRGRARRGVNAPAVAVPAGALSRSARPPARPGRTSDVATASTAGTASVSIGQLDASASLALVSSPTPQRRSDMVIVSAGGAAAPEARPTERVSRASSSGGQNWGVSLGRFPTREQADARLVQVAQQENALLQNALRHIRESSHGYEATLVGLSRSGAARTCERLAAQSLRCDVTAP